MGQALPRRYRTGSVGFRSQTRLDEIGINITREELFNFPIFLFLAVGGALHLPQVFNDRIVLPTFWILLIAAFLSSGARVRWDLWMIKFAFLFLGYTILSLAWDDTRLVITIVPTMTSICLFLYVNYAIQRFSLNDLVRLLVWCYGFLLPLSILISIAVPSIGIDSGLENPANTGAWQGVFNQKNQLGLAASLAVALALGFRPTSWIDRIWRWVLVVSAIICVIKAQSRESWIAIALLFGFALFIKWLSRIRVRERVPVMIIAGAFFSAIAVILYRYTDSLLALMGRTRDASGRSTIWDACLLLIRRKLWFGYGTYGVWMTPRAWDVIARSGWDVTSSHNTYIEILLNYGIVGTLIYSPIIICTLLFVGRALLNYDIRKLTVLLNLLIVILTISMAVPLIMFNSPMGMFLVLYCVAHLEQIERSGFMRI